MKNGNRRRLSKSISAFKFSGACSGTQTFCFICSCPGGKKKVIRGEWLFSAFSESHYSKRGQAAPLWLYVQLLALNFQKHTCERKCYMWKLTSCFGFTLRMELSKNPSFWNCFGHYLIQLWIILYRSRWKNTHIILTTLII